MPQRSGTFFVKGEKIVLKKDGTWVADGVEITHEQTRDLFFRSVHWDEAEKKFCLKVGYETMFIEVEDTPAFVKALDAGPSPVALLSSFRSQPIRAEDLEYREGNLYLKLPDGQKAKFLSAPFYDLLNDLQEDDDYYYLTIAGKRVNLLPKGSHNPAPRPSVPRRR